MRLAWIIACLLACGEQQPDDRLFDAGLPPVDPNDPLIGTWEGIDASGALDGTRVVFEASGYYETRRTSITRGFWTRVDTGTIRMCSRSCQQIHDLATRIEGTDMVFEGVRSVAGTWHFSNDSTCTQSPSPPQNGPAISWPTHSSMDVHDDGTVTGSEESCLRSVYGTPPRANPCDGTWVPTQLGIALSTMCTTERSTYFRLSDEIAPVGYRRTAP